MITTNAHIGNYGVKNDEEESNDMKIDFEMTNKLVCDGATRNDS